jgi:TatD DNase family protein
MSAWTDAHCHLQDEFIDEGIDKAVVVAATLQRAYDADVDRAVIVGTGFASSVEALALTEIQSPVELFATVGLHPHDAKNDVTPIVELARTGNARLVGIGECGLDYYYEHSPKDQQRQAFSTQIALAKELDLALVVHARGAFDDLFHIFRSEGVPERTVIHCFTGTPAEAEACLELGCDISISGIVTFKNANELREAAKLVPLERLHVETDSPFLAPVPHRGKKKEPGLRGEDPEVVRVATSHNSARLFQFPTN